MTASTVAQYLAALPADRRAVEAGSVLRIDTFCSSNRMIAMARPLRIQYLNAIYHVMSRGDRRQDIFRQPEDRVLFLETLASACGKTQWQVHAYCLMSNHFHFVVETPRPNLVAGMKWLLGTYTMRFNRRHHYSGHLFGGRYKAQVR